MLPFFLATCARSGSTLLMHLLSASGYVQTVDEHLARARYRDHYGERIEHYWNSIPVDQHQQWGTKVDVRDLPMIEGYFLFKDIKPHDVKYIWLRRRDKINQAISHCRLMRTGTQQLYKYNTEEEKKYAREDMVIPPEEINKWVVLYFMCEQVWESYFMRHEITPYILYYEDFMCESKWQETISGVLDFLSIPYEMPLNLSIDLIKQSHASVSQNYDKLIDYNQEAFQHFGYPRHFWKGRI